MKYIEYGDKRNEAIILLHGGGLGAWNYIDEASLLKDKYRIIIPILNGHNSSDKDFISIEDNALEIIDFIDNNFDESVFMINGLSLGGQILIEVLSQRSNICKYAIIESTSIIPMKLAFLLKNQHIIYVTH